MPISDLYEWVEGVSSFPMGSHSSDDDSDILDLRISDDSFVTAPDQAENHELNVKLVSRPKKIAFDEPSIRESVLDGHLLGSANQSHPASIQGFEGDDEYHHEDVQECGDDRDDEMEADLNEDSTQELTAVDSLTMSDTAVALAGTSSASGGHSEGSSSISSSPESHGPRGWVGVQNLDSMHQDSIKDTQPRRTVITITRSSAGKLQIRVHKRTNANPRVNNTTLRM